MYSLFTFNFFNILICIAAIQGLIFSGVVLYKNKTRSNFYLALVILFLSLNNLYYSAIDIGINFRFQKFTLVYLPFKLLVLPTFYLFILKYLRQKKKLLIKKILFIPFIIFVFFHIAYSLLNYLNLINIPILKDLLYYAEEYVSVLFSIYIIYKSFKLILKYEKNNFNLSKKSVKINTTWLKNLLKIGLIICLIWGTVIVINHFKNENLYSNYNRYFIWISISFLIYWIGYLGIYYNDIFSERKELRKKIF